MSPNTSHSFTCSGLPKSSALAGSCAMGTPNWWSSSRQATGTPKMQTWRATASLYNNSVDILRGASSFTCQEMTTTRQTPWHESAPPAKQYHLASPFDASSSRLSSLHQNQTPSLCRLPPKKSDPTQEPQQAARESLQMTPRAPQSKPARGLQNPARGLRRPVRRLQNSSQGLLQSARGLHQSSKRPRTPARRLPAQPPSSKSQYWQLKK